MLTAERMSRFRIVVPLEHRLDLLRALTTFGIVTLKGDKREFIIPPILQEVLENRLTPEILNIEEAIKVVKQILRENDPLRREFEEMIKKYEMIQKISFIIEKMEEMNISPKIFVRKNIGFSATYIYVKNKNIEKIRSILKELRVIFSCIEISRSEYFIIILYPNEYHAKIINIKRNFSDDTFKLPQWFFNDINKVKIYIRKEETLIKNEIIDILREIASVIKDAIEFEEAFSGELFSSAYMSIIEVEHNVKFLEEILIYLIALEIAKKILYSKSKNSINMLKSLKLPEAALDALSKLTQREFVNAKLVKERVCERKASSYICEKILSYLEDYKKYYLLYNALLYLRKENLLKENTNLLLFIGKENDIEKLFYEIINAKTTATFKEQNKELIILIVDGHYVNFVLFNINNYKVAVITANNEEFFKKLLEKSKDIGLINYLITAENDVAWYESFLHRKLEQKILVSIIYMLVFELKNNYIKIDDIIKNIENSDIKYIYQKLLDIKNGNISVKILSEDIKTEVIKRILDTAEKVIDETKEVLAYIENNFEKTYDENYKNIENKVREALKKIVDQTIEILTYRAILSVLYYARNNLQELRIFKNKRIVIAEGFIPTRLKHVFISVMEGNIPRILYFKVKDVKEPGEEAPTYVEYHGVLRYFYVLAEMLGTPSYWEINPTPIFMLLFITMYGMMFGDIGQGALISLFGLWLFKTRYRLFGISERGAQTLGVMAICAGMAATLFGIMYGGLVFLYPLWPRMAIIRPLEDIMAIIEVSLIFGVIELFVAFIISTINHLRIRDYGGAVFSGTTVLGIIYYASGVYVVYKLSESGFNIAALQDPSILPGVLTLIGAVLMIILYGVYKFLKTKDSEHIMEIFSELIEMMIAYPANSLSYIRLAAFAMAHEAFGVLAENLVPIAGFIASYIVANFFVLAIEALAVGIQSLRLLYYEFSTKFYQGTGTPFVPLVNVEAILERVTTR